MYKKRQHIDGVLICTPDQNPELHYKLNEQLRVTDYFLSTTTKKKRVLRKHNQEISEKALQESIDLWTNTSYILL